MSVSRLRWVQLTVAGVIGIALACSHAVTAPSLDNLSGTWIKNVTSHFGSCSPVPLPSPLGSDTSQYVILPAAASINSFRIHIDQSGSSIRITALDAAGNEQGASALAGTIDISDGLSVTSGVAPSRTEGPRAGGHLFTVATSIADTSSFHVSIDLPNGHISGAAFVSVGSRIYTFRDAGAAGSVFTTCIVADTGYGSTIAR
jgi:hypothetical protein